MALGKRKMENEVVEPATEEATEVVEPAATKPAATPDNGKEVATRKQAAPPSSAGPVSMNPFSELVGLIDSSQLEYNTIPRIVANNGFLYDANDKASRFDEIAFQVVSYSPRWMVTPGSSVDDARDYVKVSFDGEFCTDGTGVEEAIQEAKDAGFPKAKLSEYLDVFVLVRECPKNQDLEGELVQLSLSPSSVKKFKGFELQTGIKLSQGLISPEEAVVFRARPLLQSWESNEWTSFEFFR